MLISWLDHYEGLISYLVILNINLLLTESNNIRQWRFMELDIWDTQWWEGVCQVGYEKLGPSCEHALLSDHSNHWFVGK